MEIKYTNSNQAPQKTAKTPDEQAANTPDSREAHGPTDQGK
jgi:hypothetical protein